MKTRIYKKLILAMFFAFSLKVVIAQETTLVQVKTFDQNLQTISDLELSLDNQNYFETGNDGTIITEIRNTLLPPKVIYITDAELEAESWNYSRGVLEIIIRRKTFEIYTLTIVNTSGVPLKDVIIGLDSAEPTEATANSEGIVQLPVPMNFDLSQSGVFKIQGYRIADTRFSGNTGIITAELISTQVAKPVSSEDIKPTTVLNVDYLDSIQTLTAFFSFIRGLDMTDLNDGQKQMIDNKFRNLMMVLRDSLNQSSTLIGRISDSSLVNDDIIFLTEQALRESRYISDTRREFNEQIELLRAKLTDGGVNLSDSEREKLLSDLAKLDQLLKANELQFIRNQSSFKTALNQLKNKLLNIKDLEDLLSVSELQRLAERQAFQKQLFIVLGIISGLVLLTGLFIYLSQKFNRQRKALAVANDEVKRINDNLENLVARKTVSLRRVNKELDTFLYRSSHDLKRPLTSIIGLANVAKLTLDKKSYELFALTKKTALDMDKLLQKLLMVSHINYPSDYSEVYFPELINKVCNEFKELIEEKGISVSYEISEDIHYISYPILLEIIIKNLLENALFYSSFCADKKPEVKVIVHREDSNLYLSINDNGVGISKEVRNKVWNMFYVGNEKSTGNGLGLYIAHRAVKVLKGGISFATREGKFTTFKVQLPFEKNIIGQTKDPDKKLEGLQLA